MHLVCPACGALQLDPPVDPDGPAIVYPDCSGREPFLRQPLFFVVGPSGAGKTTVAWGSGSTKRSRIGPHFSGVARILSLARAMMRTCVLFRASRHRPRPVCRGPRGAAAGRAELEAEGSWGRDGAASFASWLAGRWQISGATARELVRDARALRARPALDAALGAGEISVDQCQALTTLSEEGTDDDAVWMEVLGSRSRSSGARRASAWRPSWSTGTGASTCG